MKISDMDKMSIGEILSTIDFPKEFVNSYYEWCKAQPKEQLEINDHQNQLQGLKAWLPDAQQQVAPTQQGLWAKLFGNKQ